MRRRTAHPPFEKRPAHLKRKPILKMITQRPTSVDSLIAIVLSKVALPARTYGFEADLLSIGVDSAGESAASW
jgi:hypothetical protein